MLTVKRRSNAKNTTQYCIDAVKLVFENLDEAYSNGTNLAARSNMQKAAYLAGMAFTRAYVGYIHAIVHTYSVPHDACKCDHLTCVLEYCDSVHNPLAELAEVVGIDIPSRNHKQNAKKFIGVIKNMNERLDIPKKVSGIIERDIPVMVERALAEANPLYPVPRILY